MLVGKEQSGRNFYQSYDSNYLHDSFMNIFFYDNQTGVQEGNNKNNR